MADPFTGMNPDFANRLRQLIAASGGRLHISSGFRTRAQQEALFRKYGAPRAAPPGHSNHERGLAADLNGDLALAHQLAPRFGLRFPLSNEAWHIEPVSARAAAVDTGVNIVQQQQGTLSPNDIAAYAYQAGFRDQGLLRIVAIALAESGGRTNARGDVGIQTGLWGPSVGLTQIRSIKGQHGTGGQRDELANLDPLTNMKNAFAISGGGTNFKPWSTFTSGAYINHLGAAQTGILHATNPSALLKPTQRPTGDFAPTTAADLGQPADPHDIGTHLSTLSDLLGVGVSTTQQQKDPHDLGTQVSVFADLLGGL